MAQIWTGEASKCRGADGVGVVGSPAHQARPFPLDAIEVGSGMLVVLAIDAGRWDLAIGLLEIAQQVPGRVDSAAHGDGDLPDGHVLCVDRKSKRLNSSH